MRIPRVYLDLPLSTGTEIELPEAAHNHLVKVLRMKQGFKLVLFNGDGFDYQAELSSVAKRESSVRIIAADPNDRESPIDIHIGQGLSRGERMDYAVQKATELGVQSLTPLFTDRSEVKLTADRQEKRSAHWQQIAISASEQSFRAKPMSVSAPMSLTEWIEQCDAELKLILHPHLELTSLNSEPRPSSVALLIGPEGGLEESEVELALQKGFKPWLLGSRILRTETAPVAAASVLNYLWGDFS
ncbi:Ribosomal RNA small subunit methyltransferase E [Marinobacterium sp. xm-a-121]|jgi:16S rRNA (uracil1498-N3)-methyltransferase|uniref:16S rRNA (uracil(1498)-N(3))-methyltransferase n=1 Tax=unclassified Marinobacterium TaxID=2644139 RepID=UPI0015687407|nr:MULTISPECIES: 16S rRNA (uracil(1498)-N(3))-methyltransferase [unclassified Marinobacterium]NRP35907.1 Ribosomal RNA small subunit methyltransferase E [Marinobacterium sp. xm-d-579]NRP39331.1 Ribosomal RNA small subunit methyltransferase E [Marinobacterium sp. xm-a-121]NRP47667.1 Ribosomal RNA small subunit methyltransferase E [Marinobacterium sp. xm-d-543]NRP59790.1 Ribosomal RNA small subunit methyltransferase E [Marinobacterium sp. xm-d-564]NRP96129.1 Ribosomal RNA small subunit methyltra